MLKKIYLCSFVDTKMKAAVKRFDKEARDMKSYDGIYLYDETLLEENFYKGLKINFHYEDLDISYGSHK